MDLFFYDGIAEECGYKFTAAVRLVAAGEAAGNEYYLRSFNFSAKTFTLSVTSDAERFLITITSGSAPALINALVVSYSQFVPGNTGIKTLGFLMPILGEMRVFAVKLYAFTAFSGVFMLQANTGSSLFSYTFGFR